MMRYCYLFLLIFLSNALEAQDPRGSNGNIKLVARSGDIHAIIIGINKYKNIPPLNYAREDAQSFYDLLQSPAFSAKKSNLKLLIDTLANRSDIYREMYDLEEKLLPNDLVIFYFAGHGDIEAKIQTNNSLLLLTDCPYKDYLRSAEFLDMNTLKEYFASLTNKKIRTLFISDACHSGSLIGGKEGQKLTSLNLQQTWASEIKLLSCQPNELSQEGKQWGNGRGIFSYHLELALKGLADNGDNILTLGEVKRYLENNVAASTNDRQNPLIIGDPKTLIANVHPLTLASAKLNGENELHAGSFATINRGISNNNDSLVRAMETKMLSKELLPLEQSAVSTGVKILSDSSLSREWKLTENLLFSYCDRLFNRYIQFYYDGTPMQTHKQDILRIKDYLNKISTIIKNEGYAADIYVKSKFIDILYSTLEEDKVPLRTLTQYLSILNELKRIKPAYPFIYKKLNELLFAAGMVTEGYNELNSYTALLPNDPYAYNYAGMAFHQLNQNEKAVEALQKAIKLKDNYFTAHFNLGVIYTKMGKKKEANESFEKAKRTWN